MKAISLWQPWASAVALGSKTIETRHWSTDYRGPLAIHAAKHWSADLRDMCELESFSAALFEFTQDGEWTVDPGCCLPFGAIVCTCDLMDCVPTDKCSGIDVPRYPEGFEGTRLSWTERDMGDYGTGRFAWILGNVKPLKTPLPWKGGQSWFTVDDAKLHEAMR